MILGGHAVPMGLGLGSGHGARKPLLPIGAGRSPTPGFSGTIIEALRVSPILRSGGVVCGTIGFGARF